MVSKEEYEAIGESLWYIYGMARRLSEVPDRRLQLTMEDAVDAEYVNECLGIALRICGRQPDVAAAEVGQPKEIKAGQLYRRCMGKAAGQAWELLWGILTKKIRQEMLTHDAWCNIDSAEAHLRELASCEADRRRHRWFFRRRSR